MRISNNKRYFFLSKKESSFVDQIENKLNKFLRNNTHIYSSDICGLGKAEKIKYSIEYGKEEKKYIYFQIGGKLSRDNILKKVDIILKRVK